MSRVSGIVKYSPDRVNIFDQAFCLFVSLLPYICTYNFPVLNLSIATVLLFLFLPHVLLRLFVHLGSTGKTTGIILAICLLYLYLSLRAEGNARLIILNVLAMIYLAAIARGALDAKLFRNFMEAFALINTGLIVLQVLAHYFLHLDIRLVLYSCLQSDYRSTYEFATSTTALYRPCGLFLEPAYFSEYCLFALISMLFPSEGRPKLWKGALVCLGIVLTTSGMGMLLMVFVFGWFLLLNKDKLDKKIVRGICVFLLAIVAFLILSRFSFFNSALSRVFSSYEGYNAFKGRTGSWSRAFSTMNNKQMLFGLGGDHTFAFYLTGLPDTIYKYGILGVVLELLVFILAMIKKKGNYLWCSSLVFIILFCVAHLTGVFLQMFYFSVVLIDLSFPPQKGSNRTFFRQCRFR